MGTLLGEWIETVRAVRNQTRAEAAAQIGVSDVLLSRWLKRGGGVRDGTRDGVARYLGVDPAVVDVLTAQPGCGARAYVTDARMQARLSRLGQLVEEVRRARRQSVAEVAAQLGVNESTIVLGRRVYDAARWRKSIAGLAAYVGLAYEEAAALAREPAEALRAWPVETWVGVKRTPMVASQGCERCAFVPWCKRDVLAGDYAWCEDVTATDFEAGVAEGGLYGYECGD